MMLPMAATVPGPEPIMEAKNMQPSTVTMPRPPRDVPDKHGGDLNDLRRHAAPVHERAREYEPHHGQQRKHVRNLEQVNHYERERNVAQKQYRDGGYAEGHEDRGAYDEHDDHDDPDEDFQFHQNTSSLGTTSLSRLVKMRHQRSRMRIA